MAFTLIYKDNIPAFTSSATTVSLTINAGATVGRLISIEYMARDVVTPPAGWTKRGEVLLGSNGQRSGLIEKIADGTEGGTTFTLTQATSTRMEINQGIWSSSVGGIAFANSTTLDGNATASGLLPTIAETGSFLALSVASNVFSDSLARSMNIAAASDAEWFDWNETPNSSLGSNRLWGAYAIYAGADTTSITWDCVASTKEWGASLVTYTEAGADVTAPILSTPSGTATGATTADLSVSTDEGNGTLYSVVTTSATAPSVAQIQLGQDNLGVAAAYSSNVAVSTIGSKSFSATGLTAATTYYAHFQHDDAIGTSSTVYTSASFTTDAAATVVTFTGTIPTLDATESAAFSSDLSGYFAGTQTPFTYAITTGTLPAGLSLNTSTGVISGTPTVVANTTGLVITATDTDTATAPSDPFTINVAAAAVVIKGVSTEVYNGAALQANVTGLTVEWHDSTSPAGLAPVYFSSTASTDALGVLTLNLDASTALALGGLGHLNVWKLATPDTDSIGTQAVLAVGDIS